MKKVRKFLGKFVVYTFLISLFLLGSSLLLGYIYRDEVTQEIVRWLAGQLNANVKIRSVDFSFLEEFPRATVIFYDFDASLKKKYAFPNARVLQGKKMKIKLNPYELIVKKKYVVEELKLEDGKIFIYERNNKWNYEYFFTNFSSTQKSSPVKLILQKLTLLRSDMDLQMFSNRLKLQAQNMNVFLYGVFSQNIYLTSQINWQKFHFRQGKKISFSFPKSLLKFIFKLQEKERFVFQKFIWETLSLKLSGNGTLVNKQLDLYLDTQNTRISDVLALLPENIQNQYDAYEPEGDFRLSLKLSGKLPMLPEIRAETEIKNAAFLLSDSLGKIKDIYTKFLLNYDLNKPQNASLALLPTTLQWKNIPLKFQAEIKNFLYPEVNAQIIGETPTEVLVKFVPREKLPVKIANGTWKFNVKIQGKLEKIKTGKHDNKNFVTGNIQVKNLLISYGKKYVKIPFAELKAVKQNIVIKNTRVFVGNSDFLINGKIPNYLSAQKIKAYLNTRSRQIRLEDLFLQTQEKRKDTSRLSYEIHLNSLIENLIVSPLKTRNVNLRLQIFPEKILFDDVLFKVFDGEMHLTKGKWQKDTVSFTYDVRNIELKEFFKTYPELAEFTDVGKYISGKISSQGRTKFKIQGNSVNYSSVFAEGKALARTLRIVNYKPLYDFSKFMKISSLKDARFQDIRTEYLIKNKKIHIARTSVQVNEFKLDIQGWQSFDGVLHYDVRFFLPNLTLFKKKAKELGIVEEMERTSVAPSLFIQIRGTTENPKFILNKKALKEKIKQDLQKEGEEFKDKKQATDEELFGKEDTAEVENLIEEEEKQKGFHLFRRK